ncbi:unnamed protein product [Durusdinium trenchii]|uniref:Uncharacterized protein n=2 Tax=Durusdinium trenchii TaxID=1381693 RepID=A0ABP0R4S2_9DINO
MPRYFQNLDMLMICVYAVWMGIDADWNDKMLITDGQWMFQTADQVFCVYFVVELMIRFFAFTNCWDRIRDPWFVLDSILVPLTIFDTWAPQPNKLGPKNPEIGFWNARSTLCRCQGQGWAEFDRTEPYQCPSVRSNLDAVLLSGQYPPTLTSTNVLNGLIESSYSLQHEKDSASVRLLS